MMEKNEASETPLVGYLSVKEKGKSSRELWFRLCEKLLLSFKNSESPIALSIITLHPSTKIEEKAGREQEFTLKYQNTQHRFKAATIEEKTKWIRRIATTINFSSSSSPESDSDDNISSHNSSSSSKNDLRMARSGTVGAGLKHTVRIVEHDDHKLLISQNGNGKKEKGGENTIPNTSGEIVLKDRLSGWLTKQTGIGWKKRF